MKEVSRRKSCSRASRRATAEKLAAAVCAVLSTRGLCRPRRRLLLLPLCAGGKRKAVSKGISEVWPTRLSKTRHGACPRVYGLESR